MATPPSSPASPATRGVDAPDVLERFESQLNLVDIIARQTLRAMGGAVEFEDLKSFGREAYVDVTGLT